MLPIRPHLFSNDVMGLLFPENLSDPGTYDSSTAVIYVKDDGNLYFNDSDTCLNAPNLSQLNADAPLQLKSYTVATLPAATAAGQMIYVSDAVGASVTGSVCFSNDVGAEDWIDVTTGAVVTD